MWLLSSKITQGIAFVIVHFILQMRKQQTNGVCNSLIHFEDISLVLLQLLDFLASLYPLS
jgi:hypothetical protein